MAQDDRSVDNARPTDRVTLSVVERADQVAPHVDRAASRRCRRGAPRKQLVAAEPKRLPLGTLGPGRLHRVITACQKTFLDVGAVAVGPSPKPGKQYMTTAGAK